MSTNNWQLAMNMAIHPEHHKAQKHLARRDMVIKDLIKQIGPCTLQHNPDGFAVLARSIISQQISTKAAHAISGRLLKVLGRSGLRPRAILKTADDDMRAAGLSAMKVRSLKDLAEKCAAGDVPLKKLAEMEDEEVIECLLPVRGIGRWTAEMFLIFSLGRLDVFPIADFGLRAGVRNQYKLPDLPDKTTLMRIGEVWRPYRSIGTWFIWRSFGNVPQSK
jgi:DNA-3-methyladenine glycosylase II